MNETLPLTKVDNNGKIGCGYSLFQIDDLRNKKIKLVLQFLAMILYIKLLFGT